MEGIAIQDINGQVVGTASLYDVAVDALEADREAWVFTPTVKLQVGKKSELVGLLLVPIPAVEAMEVEKLRRELEDAKRMLFMTVASTSGVVINTFVQRSNWELDRFDDVNGFIRLQARKVD